MDDPGHPTASCEVVDMGFGVFVARTSPPRKSTSETAAPIAFLSTSTSALNYISPYVSIKPSTSKTVTSTLPHSVFTPDSKLSNDATPNYKSLLDVRNTAATTLRPRVARRPLSKNEWKESPFRPLVPADRRILMWTTPHSLHTQASMNDEISTRLQEKIYSALLQATSDGTRESYGAGLLRFTQFCDREEVSESLRMPASATLLSAFIAEASGSCTGECIRNWLSGLRLWHLYNRAEWNGKDSWVRSLQKSADKAGAPLKRPARNPISMEHLSALRNNVDITSHFGAAVWAAALAAFWGCRRLGELLVASSFSKEHDVSRDTRFSLSVVNGRKVISFHLPWTKTTGIAGGDCILTATDDAYCPVVALANHFHINSVASSDSNIPLFAYRTGEKFRTLRKDQFLRLTTDIFTRLKLEAVFGHSYRIGGSLKLLSDGVAPEIVMKIGGWSSLCFMLYWRRLELIIPAAITRAWEAQRKEFAKKYRVTEDLDSFEF